MKLPHPNCVYLSIIFVLLVLLLPACGGAAPIADEVTPPSTGVEALHTPTLEVNTVMSSPDYGVQTFLFWREEVADRDLKFVQQAGLRWVKQEFPWRELECQAKGVWQWAATDRIIEQIEAHQLKVIVRLGSQPAWAAPNLTLPEVGPPDNLADFYDYVYAVANRYKGRVEAYQICE